ncbi:MAG TPA: cytochrome c biogenesis protein ResB [Jiangellaceae bacterium]|nr:cytochrome c biogenesis protein ResB [Jiangellaceae bacterium]
MTVREASTTEATEPGRPPALSPSELAAWAWRQLTSMRVALILLFLLAVAAIPGSVVPQREINPLAVADFRDRNPALAQWYDRLGLFDVFSAPWFAAIYLALIVSLVGCIVPRSFQHWRATRADPPPAPRRLSRMPAYRRFETGAPPADVLAAARDVLKSRRFRLGVGVRPDAPRSQSGRGAVGGGSGRLKSDSWHALRPRIAEPAEPPSVPRPPSVEAATTDSVAADAGQLRETGNLVFHLAVVVVLTAVAVGSLFGYRATVIVPEGSGFANSVIQYDGLSSGALFDASDLPPFSLELDGFDMQFVEAGSQLGAPDDFEATVRFTPEPGAEEETRTIRVNEPLEVGGTLIHILNPGYAPLITIRDAKGTVLAEGPVPFLPQDDSFTSTGVRKVPVGPGVALGEDIGIQGVFLPTALLDDKGPRSIFPEPRNPALFFTAFHGDLGLDDGRPQSVYRLDPDGMEQFRAEDDDVFRAALTVGETATLPDGYGSVTFDGYVSWVNFQVSRNAGKEFVLAGAMLALAGLLLSLYVRRRRVWVRATEVDGGGTVVEVAGLQRSDSGDLDAEVGAVTDELELRVRSARPEG